MLRERSMPALRAQGQAGTAGTPFDLEQRAVERLGQPRRNLYGTLCGGARAQAGSTKTMTPGVANVASPLKLSN